MPNIMTGIISHASTHPYAYYISASKPWDPDAPLWLLTYARQFDKWVKTWRNFFSCSKLNSLKPVMLLSPPPPLRVKFELANLLMGVRFVCLRDFLLQSLASFGKNIMEVRSKYTCVHAYYPMLAYLSCMCGIWSLNRSPLTAEPFSQANYYLSIREQGSMPTQFSIAFAASTNSIRVYLGSRLTLDTWR